MRIEDVKRKIMNCVHYIYTHDSDLFTRNNYELTISTKLAQYLFNEFREYDVDCEYNKHISDVKYSKDIGHNIRPDIVIHKRGNDDINLVCIEIKKVQSHEPRDYDQEKIISLTKKTGDYKYEIGVLIDFSPDITQLAVKYFIDGELIE